MKGAWRAMALRRHPSESAALNCRSAIVQPPSSRPVLTVGVLAALPSPQLLHLDHSRGLDMISLLLEMIQSTLRISIVIMKWRAGGDDPLIGQW